MENKAKRSTKEMIARVIILFIGLTIAHLGVTLFLLSNLGADPFNVLIQGLHKIVVNITGITAITHGNVHMAVCFIIIIALLFIERSYIKIGTVICMFCGGPIIDFFNWAITGIFGTEYMLVVKIAMLAAGCVILAYGMTIVIKSDAGTGPNDLVAIVISDKLKKRFGIVRLIVDSCFVILGFILGGVFGAGTIVCAFLVGPVADIFLPINEKMINKIIGKISRQNI